MKKSKIIIIIVVVVLLVGGAFFFFMNTISDPLDDSRVEAAAAATKSALGGLMASISLCCGNPGSELNPNMGGGADICIPAVGIIGALPTADELFAESADYEITAGCTDATPTITVTIQNHRKSECSGVWTIKEMGVDFPPGC